MKIKIRQILSILILITSSISLSSCFISAAVAKSQAKKEFTEEFKAIPPDFGKKNTVLLIVLKKRSSYDKYLKNATKKYNGEVTFINEGEEILPEYNNKQKYRFIFDYIPGSSSTITYSNGLSSTVIAKRFYVKDRLNDIYYQTSYETAFFGKALKAYMENLEIKRISMLN